VTVVEVLQVIVVPLLVAVLADVRSTRAELVKVRERVASLETAVEIGLGLKALNRGGDGG
jgi:hypothetical protein